MFDEWDLGDIAVAIYYGLIGLACAACAAAGVLLGWLLGRR